MDTDVGTEIYYHVIPVTNLINARCTNVNYVSSVLLPI